MTQGAVESILQGNGEGLEMGVIIQCLKGLRDPRMDVLLKKIESQCVDIHFLCMSFNPIPIQVGYVDEEAKGLGKIYLKALGIFTDHFVDKHTAKDKATAQANATTYGNSVTVIKITETQLKVVLEAHKDRKTVLTPTTIWYFVNEVEHRAQPNVHIKYENGKMNHLSF